MTVPNNKILILAALCLSVVASVGAYKIGEARKASLLAQNSQGAVYLDVKKTDESNALLQDALKKISDNASFGSSTAGNPFAPSENDTLTDTLAKNLFLSYADIQNGTSNLDNETVAANVVGSIDASSLPQAIYSLSDIKISTAVDKDGIKTYANAVGKILTDNYTYISNNKDKLSLSQMGEIHTKIGELIIKVPVPAALSQSHLAMANDYIILGKGFVMIADQEERDPLKSLLAIRTTKDAGENLDTVFKEINSYFIKNDILFNNNEPGVIWSRIDLN